jgi:chromosome segregation ATPase
VRETLKTGSNSTIAEHLKRWQQALSEAPKTVLPPTVPEAVGDAFMQFWRFAAEQAEANFQTQREQGTRAVLAAERTRDEAIEKMQEAYDKIEALLQQLEQLDQRFKTQEKKLIREGERRLQAERTIGIAEQSRLEALHGVEEMRAEKETRIAQINENFRQLRENAEKQRVDAGNQLTFERERNQANEAKMTQVINQNRTDFAKERNGFLDERKQSSLRERGLRTQLEENQQNLANARLTIAGMEERLQSLSEEKSYYRDHQEKLQSQCLAAIRLSETLGSELKAIANEQKGLSDELQILKIRLKSCGNTPFTAPG